MARPVVPTLRSKLRGVQENVNGAMANRENPGAVLRHIQVSREALTEARETVLEHCGHRPVEGTSPSDGSKVTCVDCGKTIKWSAVEEDPAAWRCEAYDDEASAICATRLEGEA